MTKSFKNYKVVETEGMTAKDIQKILDTVTDGIPEMQIDHVIGTKIIFSYDSLFNETGRNQARISRYIKSASE